MRGWKKNRVEYATCFRITPPGLGGKDSKNRRVDYAKQAKLSRVDSAPILPRIRPCK